MTTPPVAPTDQPVSSQAKALSPGKFIGIGNMVAGGFWFAMWLFFYSDHSRFFDLSWYMKEFPGLAFCGVIQLGIGLCQFLIARLQLSISGQPADSKNLWCRLPSLRRWLELNAGTSAACASVPNLPPVLPMQPAATQFSIGALIREFHRPILFALIGAIAINILQEDCQLMVLVAVILVGSVVWWGSKVAAAAMFSSNSLPAPNQTSTQLAPCGIDVLYLGVLGSVAFLFTVFYLSQTGGATGAGFTVTLISGALTGLFAASAWRR